MPPPSPCQVDSRRGVCGCCLRAAKWVPVVFISAIVVWSYYAYVVHLCFLTIQSVAEQVLLLVLYHFFFAMFVWAYWRTVFTPPGSVPTRFQLSLEEMDKIETSDNAKVALEQIVIAKDLPCTMRSIQQEVRYCSECSIIKPDRSHHCGVCGQCVLKMDHHCPWVNNCVAFMNYKFFILFLGYALLYCIFVALSSLKYFLEFWTSGSQSDSGKFHVLFLFFVSAMFSISLASLFFYHLYLVSRNMSTLEAFRTPIFRNGADKFAFHLGRFNNFQEVFGDNKLTWFLPVFTSFGDGVTFPQRGQLDGEAGLLGMSPPITEFSSEEHVPMMTQGRSETSRWNEVLSSSGSDSDLRNGAAARVNSSANGSAKPFRKDHTLVTM